MGKTLCHDRKDGGEKSERDQLLTQSHIAGGPFVTLWWHYYRNEISFE